MKVKLLEYTPPENIIATAAKLCYSKAVDIDTLMNGLTPEKVNAFVEKLESLGHMSPLEHASFTFAIEDVSRALLAQLSRHRVGTSLSVRSQRYIAESSFDTVMPDTIYENDEARILFRSLVADTQKAYNRMLEIGIPKEDARSILPNACCTRLILTMNVRQLLHFFTLRCCTRAQKEIRTLANEMLKLCKRESPTVFKHAGASCVRGYCQEGAMSCGKAPTMEMLLEAYKESR